MSALRRVVFSADIRRRWSMRPAHRSFRLHAVAFVMTVAASLAGCKDTPSREAQEAAKNTFACQLDGQRLVMKFDVGEARLLMPDGNRVILYQVPMGSGIRYTNGDLDLRGKGTDLQLIRNGNSMQLADCQPYRPPQ
jgi:membrane-bound inhibitor of C-type lysozyme